MVATVRFCKHSDVSNMTEVHGYIFLHSSLSEANKRIVYKIFEYSPLLDSSNMTTDDWGRIGKDIEVFAAQFLLLINSIFVIL